jgi:hypothetical protein
MLEALLTTDALSMLALIVCTCSGGDSGHTADV